MSDLDRWRENLTENVRLARLCNRTGDRAGEGLALYLCEVALKEIKNAALAEAIASAKRQEGEA